jgi:hypothetical protein
MNYLSIITKSINLYLCGVIGINNGTGKYLNLIYIDYRYQLAFSEMKMANGTTGLEPVASGSFRQLHIASSLP